MISLDNDRLFIFLKVLNLKSDFFSLDDFNLFDGLDLWSDVGLFDGWCHIREGLDVFKEVVVVNLRSIEVLVKAGLHSGRVDVVVHVVGYLSIEGMCDILGLKFVEIADITCWFDSNTSCWFWSSSGHIQVGSRVSDRSSSGTNLGGDLFTSERVSGVEEALIDSAEIGLDLGVLGGLCKHLNTVFFRK